MKFLLTSICFCVGLILFAQVPQGINYQAIVRDGAGAPITTGPIAVDITITNGGGNFTETHSVTPNQFGLVNFVIGSINTGAFQAFDFSDLPLTIAVEAAGNSLGSQNLQSVPFSLLADRAFVADSVDGVDLNTLETITVSNGLTKVGADIQLGGLFSNTVDLDLNGNELNLRDGNEFIVEANIIEFSDAAGVYAFGVESGQVSVGHSSQNAKFRYVDGSQALGKVLVSDASGVASWQDPILSPWLVNGSFVYYNAGNVGIGVIAPSTILHIYQANNPVITLEDDNNSCSIQGGTDLVMSTSGLERFRVMENGRVGIGTSSPAGNLSIHVNSTSGAPYTGYTNSTTGQLGTDGFEVGINSGEAAVLWNNENTSMHFATNNTSQMTLTGLGNLAVGSTLDTYGQTAHQTVFTTPTRDKRILINARSNSGTGRATLVLSGQNLGGGGEEVAMIDFSNATTSQSYNFARIAATSESTNATYGALRFYTRLGSNLTQKMMIDENGNVGIGTLNPAYSLDVTSTANTSTSYAGRFNNTSTTSTNRRGVYGYITGTGGGQNLGVYGSATGGSTANYGVYGSGSTAGGGTAYGVYCSGNMAYTGTITDVSDIKFKKNIQDLDKGLKAIIALRPVSYDYKMDEYGFMGFEEGEQMGFVAQEVELVIPSLVLDAVHPSAPIEEGGTGQSVDYKSLSYIGLIPVLTKAIQEQQDMIEILNGKLQELETEVELLKQ